MENQKVLTGVVVIAVIAILGAGVLWYTNAENGVVSPDQQRQAEQVDQTMLEATEFAMYADGQYEAVGQYTSPGGGETIDVSITLEDNIITDVVVVPNAQLPISVRYQGQFTSGVADAVIGKNINEVQLDVVSGSSLTPIGFNNALDQIKAEAGIAEADRDDTAE
jgi:uncharacterized protein with FMN-binding domain